MDLTCTPNPTPTPTPTKTPDSEIDTPPLIKPLSFTNNRTFKNHHHHQPPCTAVIYKECLKNHAASIGGHALDGCGEFIASPDSTPSDPISLKCAACGCHRNFHRREPSENSTITTTHFIDFRHHVLPPIRRFSASPTPSPSPSPPPPPPQPQPVTPTENLNRRKRFRTKFTQEQKEKMHVFSEKLGWKLQKCDEVAVDEFCNDIGVGKGVLRVWMHNNKNTFGRKEYHQALNNSSRDHSFDEEKNGLNMNGTTSSNEDNHHQSNNNNDSNCGLHLHISTNGSSSSS